MSHTIELTDEQYATLEQAAQMHNATPPEMLAGIIADLRARDTAPQAYETEDWFRHLGASEEVIAEGMRIHRERQRQSPLSDMTDDQESGGGANAHP